MYSQLILLIFGLTTLGVTKAQLSEVDMIQVLNEYDQDSSKLCNENSLADWNVQTDVLNTTLVAEQVSESYGLSMSKVVKIGDRLYDLLNANQCEVLLFSTLPYTATRLTIKL